MDLTRLCVFVCALFVAIFVQSIVAQTGHVLGGNCTVAGNCSSVGNATCTNKTCVCTAAFKRSGQQCAPKGLGDQCKATPECAAVTTSICKPNGSKTCECPAKYKVVSGQCKPKVIGAVCTAANAATVCSDKNSECKNATIKTCGCKSGFHTDNDQCLADSAAESQRIALHILYACLLLTVFKVL